VNLGWDRQRNEGILRRHAQGCVEASLGLEDPNLPLSAPSGVSRPLLDLLRSWKANSVTFAYTAF
jgi:hypothetical protein